MAGTDTPPGAVNIIRTSPTTLAVCSGNAAKPALRPMRVEMLGAVNVPKIKAIWLSEKGPA